MCHGLQTDTQTPRNCPQLVPAPIYQRLYHCPTLPGVTCRIAIHVSWSSHPPTPKFECCEDVHARCSPHRLHTRRACTGSQDILNRLRHLAATVSTALEEENYRRQRQSVHSFGDRLPFDTGDKHSIHGHTRVTLEEYGPPVPVQTSCGSAETMQTCMGPAGSHCEDMGHKQQSRASRGSVWDT